MVRLTLIIIAVLVVFTLASLAIYDNCVDRVWHERRARSAPLRRVEVLSVEGRVAHYDAARHRLMIETSPETLEFILDPNTPINRADGGESLAGIVSGARATVFYRVRDGRNIATFIIIGEAQNEPGYIAAPR